MSDKRPARINLVPVAQVVQALQYTGENFCDISLLVPLNMRGFMPKPVGESSGDYLMIQTPSGVKFVQPGDYIVHGRVGSELGFFVFSEEELKQRFVIHNKDSK